VSCIYQTSQPNDDRHDNLAAYALGLHIADTWALFPCHNPIDGAMGMNNMATWQQYAHHTISLAILDLEL